MKYLIILVLALAHTPVQAVDGYPLTRSKLVEGYTTWFNFWDLDHDGKIDRNEWSKSLEATFPENVLAEARDHFLSEFDKDDLDRNGYLSLEETLHSPLKSFECIDVNRDGKVSRSEVSGARERCAGL